MVEYVKTVQRGKSDWALRIDVLFQKNVVQKHSWKDARDLYLGKKGFCKKTRVPLLKYLLGDTKNIGYTARQHQNQNWSPHTLAPLLFPQNIYNFLKGSELFWVLGYLRDPCYVSFWHLPLCSWHPSPLFLSWAFSLPAQLPRGQTLQAHTRPFPCTQPTFQVRRALHGALRRFLHFFNTREEFGRFYRWTVTIAKVSLL